MALTLSLVGILALVLWLTFLWRRRRFYKVAWQLPGPLGLPFIGLGLQMMNLETFLHYIDREAKKYTTPFITWMGPSCFLYVNDPETAECIFNSPHCTNKGDFYRFITEAIGDGLFTSNSPRWNKHRRLIDPAFNRQVINNFLPVFNAQTDELMQKFTAVTGGHGTGRAGKCELLGVLKKTILDVACQTTMGRHMNFQNDGSAAIFEAYNGMTEALVKRILSPWLHPDFIYHRSAQFRHQQKVVNLLTDFIEDLLQLSNKSSVKMQLATAKDLDLQADNSEEDADDATTSSLRKSKAIFVDQVRYLVHKGELTWDDMRDEANVVIGATFETTSCALYLVCLCLAMHPEYQDKLYDELVELFPLGENNNNSKNTHTNHNNNTEHTNCRQSFEVTNEHLERMPYTEMVINEAMRLFAPVPMVLRSASADFALPNGVIIPCGTQIGIDIFNMHRHESVWGPQARQFRPELHFGPTVAPHHPFGFVPFTKGLRMCLGHRYALMMMKVMLAKIFRDFRIRTDARMEDLIIRGTITLTLRDYPLCELISRHN